MKIDLVIQGHVVEARTLDALVAASGARQAVVLEAETHAAFRLPGANPASKEQVATLCDGALLDHAFVDANIDLSRFGLIAMDMDSTLITIECIDEIADFAGRKAEVASVTAAAMRGEIDWPESLRQRVRALAGLPADVLNAVYRDRLTLSPGASRLIHVAQSCGIKLLLVSGGFTFFTDQLRARLGLDYAFSNQLEIIDGKLSGRVVGPLCDADAKARHLHETAASLGLDRSQVMAIGDGANDLKMLAEAGTSIAYHAKPAVRAQASHVLSHAGLDGVLALFPSPARPN
jgi:phosphoserine phosphatase